MSAWLQQLKALFRREQFDNDLQEEMRLHRDLRAARLRETGLSDEDAGTEAHRRFGNELLLRERSREWWTWRWFDALELDIRYAFRQIRRGPAFTAVAVLTLALGIGSNAAIFSLLDQILYKALPVSDPRSLVAIHFEGVENGGTSSDNNESVFSWSTYTNLRDRTPAIFDGVIARSTASQTVVTPDRAELLTAEVVSGNFFEVLRVEPAIGRLLNREDDALPSGNPVVVLSWEYWQRQFGRRTDILNQSIRVSGFPMTVVGVVKQGFRSVVSGQTPDLYMPITASESISHSHRLEDHRMRWLTIVARLRPGVTMAQAQSGAMDVFRQILREEVSLLNTPSKRFHTRFLNNRIELRPAAQGINQLQQPWARPLTLVLCLVGMVLLICCVNIAGLLISRAAARGKELAIRLAIGANRWAILRQHFVESAILCLAGGSLGVLASSWFTQGLLSLTADEITGGWLQPSIDRPVLLFSLALTAFTTLLFGLAPAIYSNGTKAISAMKERTGSSTAHVRLRQILVAAQIAFSLILLIAGGLLIRSFSTLASRSPGFAADRLLTAALYPELSGYGKDRLAPLGDRIAERLRALPNVTGVAFGRFSPFGDADAATNLTIEGYNAAEGEDMNSGMNVVSPGYYRTLGTPLLSGREFTEADRAGGKKVGVVNEKFARRFFGNHDPIGKHFVRGAGSVVPDIEIVGVVSDSTWSSMKKDSGLFYSLPVAQDPPTGRLTFFIRTSRPDLPSMMADVRRTVREIDNNLPVAHMWWMRDRIDQSLYLERLMMLLATGFGAVATILAGIGLYGVLALQMTARTAEIGIRMALGSSRTGVARLVLKDVAVVVAVGIAIGLPASFGAERLMRSQLFGAQTADPAVVVGAVVLLVAVALAAAFLPVRRATGIDPLAAIRYE